MRATIHWVAQATGLSRRATRPAQREGVLKHRHTLPLLRLTPFRPAGCRTEQAGRLFYPSICKSLIDL